MNPAAKAVQGRISENQCHAGVTPGFEQLPQGFPQLILTQRGAGLLEMATQQVAGTRLRQSGKSRHIQARWRQGFLSIQVG